MNLYIFWYVQKIGNSGLGMEQQAYWGADDKKICSCLLRVQEATEKKYSQLETHLEILIRHEIYVLFMSYFSAIFIFF